MKKQLCSLLAGITAAGLLAGCGGQGGFRTSGETITESPESTAEISDDIKENTVQTEILVAAAASLKNAYEDQLIPMFEEQYPDITVTGTYDSSGKLQIQIEEGLEADVFMSAAMKQMKALDDKGLVVSDTITGLLENQIVLIVPKGNEGSMKEFADIAGAEVVVLGDPDSVPAGQYAKEALLSLGIWDSVRDKASFAANVTEVLNQVAESGADAGIVYATDAAGMTDKVAVVAAAPEGSLKEKIIYPVAVIKTTAHRKEADRFMEFLKTEEAIQVFQAYGFSVRD